MRNFALALALTLAIPAARAAEDDAPEPPYANQPAFVRWPGYLVGGLLTIPGSVVGSVLVCPAKAVAQRGQKEGEYKPCVSEVTKGSFYAGTAIGGFPFYFIKRLAWDWPKGNIKHREAPPPPAQPAPQAPAPVVK